MAAWLVQGFDGERIARAAGDWMRTHHQRELVFDGPVRLQLWPQPAVAVQRVRLSERGQPDTTFATIDSASLSLYLQPLLARREIEVESVSARGVRLSFGAMPTGRATSMTCWTASPAVGRAAASRWPSTAWNSPTSN